MAEYGISAESINVPLFHLKLRIISRTERRTVVAANVYKMILRFSSACVLTTFITSFTTASTSLSELLSIVSDLINSIMDTPKASAKVSKELISGNPNPVSLH